jgi:hypothetical protein
VSRSAPGAVQLLTSIAAATVLVPPMMRLAATHSEVGTATRAAVSSPLRMRAIVSSRFSWNRARL